MQCLSSKFSILCTKDSCTAISPGRPGSRKSIAGIERTLTFPSRVAIRFRHDACDLERSFACPHTADSKDSCVRPLLADRSHLVPVTARDPEPSDDPPKCGPAGAAQSGRLHGYVVHGRLFGAFSLA